MRISNIDHNIDEPKRAQSDLIMEPEALPTVLRHTVSGNFMRYISFVVALMSLVSAPVLAQQQPNPPRAGATGASHVSASEATRRKLITALATLAVGGGAWALLDKNRKKRPVSPR